MPTIMSDLRQLANQTLDEWLAQLARVIRRRELWHRPPCERRRTRQTRVPGRTPDADGPTHCSGLGTTSTWTASSASCSWPECGAASSGPAATSPPVFAGALRAPRTLRPGAIRGRGRSRIVRRGRAALPRGGAGVLRGPRRRRRGRPDRRRRARRLRRAPGGLADRRPVQKQTTRVRHCPPPRSTHSAWTEPAAAAAADQHASLRRRRHPPAALQRETFATA